MANHSIESHVLSFNSKTGSRNRVRIPVAGTRFAGQIHPGDRVTIKWDFFGVVLSPDNNGKYKVEKDGAIRFPAHRYQLPLENLYISSEEISGMISVTI